MLSFLGIYTFAIVSPGPNFFLVTNTAMSRSRNEGVLVSFGVATGSGIFAFAGLVGLLPLVHSLPFFALIMRFLGGGYLVWIGIDMLRSCRCNMPVDEEGQDRVSALVPYRVGLLTNLTNPKAWAFYLSLFTLFIGTTFPLWSKIVLNVSMLLISLAWYAAMAILISSRAFQPLFMTCKPVVQGGLGMLLVIAGGKVLWG
jgi:threonine/homoserine/homoserine lactone efflux protein